MRQNQMIRERWWLMTCDFPDLNWARLRVYQNGLADVFDCDGRTKTFPSVDAAEEHLREDEYIDLEQLDPDDQEILRSAWNSISPPTAQTDSELVSLMFRRVGQS